MPSLCTLAGIQEALSNLGLKKRDSLKAQLVERIQAHYQGAADPGAVLPLETDLLVSQLWLLDDAAAIRAKRKSFSSLKSGLNKQLRDLAKEGLNPEGIIIGRDNLFVVSDEHKDSLLQELGVGGGGAPAVRDVFTSIKELVTEVIQKRGIAELTSLLQGLEEAKQLVRTLAQPDAAALIGPVAAPTVEAAGGTAPGAPAGHSRTPSPAQPWGGPPAAGIIEETAAEPPAPVGSAAGAEAAGTEERPAAEEVEILQEEVEELEEADETEIVQGIEPLPGDQGLDTGEPMPAADLEDRAEAVDFDEVEELEEAGEAEILPEIEPLPGDQGLDTGEPMPAADLED
ncbi:MAG: hypothetical protein AB1634_19085, partial [Thermodesulfobacteriota bacterium]